MEEMIIVYRMQEVSVKTRIKLIKDIGHLVNYKYASNVTESLQMELIKLLDEEYDFASDDHLKYHIVKG